MNVNGKYFFYRKMFSKMKFCLKITRFLFYIGLREEKFLANYILIIKIDFKRVLCHPEIMI